MCVETGFSDSSYFMFIFSCVRSVKLNSDGDHFLFSDPCFFVHVV